MKTVSLIELGVSVVIFALCLVGLFYTNSKLKIYGSETELKIVKKTKRNKKLFTVGVVFGIWFALGVLFSAFSGKKAGMPEIEFQMFSERMNIFGISIAKTTVIALGVSAVAIILCILFRLFAVPKFKEEPKGLQNAMEICVEAVDNFTKKAVGEKASVFLSPYMFAIALFLIGSAAAELLGLRAPTSDLTVTVSLGLLTFILLNIFGIKKLGISGRLKSMGGPVAPMRVIMIPLKMVSDIAVPISLGCRLFGNMLGGMIVMDLLKGALGGYAVGLPAVAGLYFNLFHPLIQAYIFVTLSLTFIDEAMEGEEKQKKNKKINAEKTA